MHDGSFDSFTEIFAAGLGLVTRSSAGQVLEVYYHKPFTRREKDLSLLLKANSGPVDDFVALCQKYLGYKGQNQTISLAEFNFKHLREIFADHQGTVDFLNAVEPAQDRAVITILEVDSAPTSVEEVYLKLHLLSHRFVKPHGVNLTGCFGILPIVAWTNEGAIALEEVASRQLSARVNGRVLHVHSVDKFPQMANYVVPYINPASIPEGEKKPGDVRVAVTSRVRLGAYLGPGTTIMHEGFVNFNAGTEGPAMIEGRISAGVFVGAGSDLGGGASTMGTLSGGGNIVISVGKECLIGANAGIGIPLGDRCKVESGLYVTAGTKVTLIDGENELILKASELSGRSDLTFRRNSLTGRVEAVVTTKAVELNPELHA